MPIYSPTVQKETITVTKLSPSWNVIVLNDPVNLMSYVVVVFKRVLGFSDTKARKHMLEVHQKGRSIVWTGEREKAEAYLYSLQEWHLTVILEKVSNDH